ncbi:conserved hypothetical protein [Kamptonema sp. PCC 6506]|jgi:hypothetical protein|nr:conserved hypothetical protein [Kamptonema sp. PCC 6506]
MGERFSCKEEVVGSTPIRSTVSEAKVVAALVCGTSNNGFNSRQTPLEDAAEWPATGLENQGIANNYRGSIPPSSFDHWEPESAALC